LAGKPQAKHDLRQRGKICTTLKHAGHAIHRDDKEIARLAAARVGVTHCPCSNQLLASGTCRVCTMEQARVPVGLGVDGSASNNASNLMQEASGGRSWAGSR